MPNTIDLDFDKASSEQSIAAIIAAMEPQEIEQLAIDVIIEQRRRLEITQGLYECLNAGHSQELSDMARQELRYKYHLALIQMKAHHALVATVLHTLGYVPKVPGDDATH
ncbi:transcriptional repressor TraM [Hartmannibacter diazotrophicus]|uniref:transcriptional repressor TraM n=1 Tax=Hartmannibacter diazotrophicus TaxID=1482074 RepID=UPI000C14BC4E|nr:transcriptional repressor TraM [Hartmannibacter diazotrophicus]